MMSFRSVCWTRPPSAELKPDQKDSDSLPDYAILDPILHAYVEESYSLNDIVALGFDRDTVLRVIRMVDRNEYKPATESARHQDHASRVWQGLALADYPIATGPIHSRVCARRESGTT